MKTFSKSETNCKQGDLMLLRGVKLPADVKPVQPEGGRYVLAHSETGHHHTVQAEGLTVYQGQDPMVCYLVSETGAYDVTHHREHHTHEAFRVECQPGEVIARVRQREHAPEGWRIAQD